MSLSITWEGMKIAISHIPGWPIKDFNHLEIKSDKPNPITETGYKSHFISQAELALFRGPEDFVQQWMEAEAIKPKWIDYVNELKLQEEASRQTTFDF